MNLDADPRDLERRLAQLGRDDARLPMLLNELGWALRLEDPARAAALVDRAHAEAERLGDRHALAWALRNQAFFGMVSPDPRGTLERAERARSLFEELGDELGLAIVWDLLATVHEALGDYSVAMEYASDALAAARRLGYERGIGWALSSIGGILAASGDALGARRHFEEALALFESLNYPIGIRRLCGRLGRLELSQGEPLRAREYFERDLALDPASNNPVFAALTRASLGEVEEALGDLDAAAATYAAALAVLPELAQEVFGLSVRLNLARVAVKRGDHDGARALLTSVADAARDREVAPVESRARELLADVLEHTGDCAGALAELRRYVALREKELGAETRTRLKHLEIRMELETARSAAEIHRLRYVELERAQAQLVEAEKMAAFGNLAAGIAHELNTPVGVIQSAIDTADRALERLESELGDAPRPQRLVGTLRALRAPIGQALQRISELGTSLGRFAQLDEAERQPVDLAAGVEAACTLLAALVPAGVCLEKELAQCPPVWGHAGQLNHVILTVLRNAIESVGREGRVAVRLAPEGEHVRLSVSDSGPPLTPEEAARLFDARFRASGQRVQFRLGMAAAAATLRNHGGTAEVASHPDGGTTVAVHLPALR